LIVGYLIDPISTATRAVHAASEKPGRLVVCARLLSEFFFPTLEEASPRRSLLVDVLELYVRNTFAVVPAAQRVNFVNLVVRLCRDGTLLPSNEAFRRLVVPSLSRCGTAGEEEFCCVGVAILRVMTCRTHKL
jgi:hypothetical protein